MHLIGVLWGVLLLAGCGFTPLYHSSGGDHRVQAALEGIYIDIIPDREGQYLRNRLIDRFHSAGTPDAPRYRLSVAPLREQRTNLDITKTANTTRAQLRLNSRMVLRDAGNGAILLERDLTATASYNVLDSQFTTRVSEENARLNVLDALAQQAEQQIVLFLKRKG